MKHVLVRKPLRSGDNELIMAQVISESNGIMRVKFEHSQKLEEVKAADTLPATSVFGNFRREDMRQVTIKNYPGANTVAARVHQGIG